LDEWGNAEVNGAPFRKAKTTEKGYNDSKVESKQRVKKWMGGGKGGVGPQVIVLTRKRHSG